MGGWWGWSYLLTLVGCTGFLLAGRKVWWAWWVNVGCQGIWVAYALATRQWGFLISVPVYLAVFIPNAVRWTRERHPAPDPQSGWLVDSHSVDGEVHVVPLDDLIQHPRHPGCSCGPSVERGVRGDLYVHHAIDERTA